VPFRVAVVKVGEALAGAAGLTHVKVGLPPPPPEPPPPPPGVQAVVRPKVPRVTLTDGQEGCFFLSKHPTAGFYVMHPHAPPLDPKAAAYKAQSDKVRRAAAALADPVKALQADQPEDRFLAAATLTTKYRTYPPAGGPVEQVPVSAEESRLIVRGLLEHDWTKHDPDVGQVTQLALQLGMGKKDGWDPAPYTGEGDFNALMQGEFRKWAGADGSKFVVRRFVPKAK
jgi:hypothetical protein